MKTKRCARCRRYKAIDKFGKDKSRRDGLNKYCKRCASPNPEKYGTFKKRGKKLDEGKEWCGHCKKYKKTSEFGINNGKLRWQCKRCHVAIENERYFSMPQSERDALNRATYKRQSEKLALMGTTPGRVSYSRNREKSKRKAREWQVAHKLHRHKYMLEYYKKHPDKWSCQRHNRRAKERNATGEYTETQWKKLIAFYVPDGKCLRCKKDPATLNLHWKFLRLTHDHIIPIGMGGTNDIGNLQPLCMPCNLWKKRRTDDFRKDGGKFARELMKSE